jgi:hypothetical protein
MKEAGASAVTGANQRSPLPLETRSPRRPTAIGVLNAAKVEGSRDEEDGRCEESRGSHFPTASHWDGGDAQQECSGENRVLRENRESEADADGESGADAAVLVRAHETVEKERQPKGQRDLGEK